MANHDCRLRSCRAHVRLRAVARGIANLLCGFPLAGPCYKAQFGLSNQENQFE